MSDSIKTAFDTDPKAFENFIHAIQELDTERPEKLSMSSWEDELGRQRFFLHSTTDRKPDRSDTSKTSGYPSGGQSG